MSVLISVVIPAHDVAPYIGDALESVARQSTPPHEVIVVDDGSRDGTADEVRRSALQTRLLRQPNRGVSAARNHGIEAATGDWIAFLDADDVWYANHLQEAQRSLEARSPTDVGYMAECEPLSSGPRAASRPPVASGTRTRHDYLREFSAGRAFATNAIVAQRRALLDCGLFRVGMTHGEDLDLWLRLIGGSHTWIHNPVVTNGVRARPGSASADLRRAARGHLEALLQNLTPVEREIARTPLAEATRRVVATELTDAAEPDVSAAWQIAAPHMRPRDRLIMGVACRMPALFRSLNRLRRRLRRPRHGLRTPATSPPGAPPPRTGGAG